MPNLQTPIEKIPQITARQKNALAKLKMEKIQDLIFHFPFRYDDFSNFLSIDQLEKDQTATVEGVVQQIKQTKTWKRKMFVSEVFLQDQSGLIRAVWFNQPYLLSAISQGDKLRLSGKVSADANGFFFSSPAWEKASREPTNTAGLVPIYSESEGVTSKWLRWKIQTFLPLVQKVSDPIPAEILEKLNLPNLSMALQWIHFPQNRKKVLIAQKRFAFQQMFFLQLSSFQIRQSRQKERAVPFKSQNEKIQKFLQTLPFEMTGAQKRAWQEISQDLQKNQPMNRLLNGDVGSGKTLVALLAALLTKENKLQTALLAPTEILARQHFESAAKLLKKTEIKIALLTGAYQKSFSSQADFQQEKRAELLEKIRQGEIDLVIGTHALIQKDVFFKNLALIIVDEQHRFGVNQRAHLQKEIEKINDGIKNKIPHLLSMTATAIPRTLAMAFFGSLDVSLLNEMPKNRLPIKTQIFNENQRPRAYEFIKDQIRQGRQAFIIFPLVEESESLSELKAAVSEHQKLDQKIFPNLSLGLLHGQMKPIEKEKTMQEFKDRKFDILVATSVVEVGIDIPNASVILIEDADRFGLAQLHQFRGRVGRGEHQSFCLLFSSKGTANARLKVLEKTNDGFEIAQKDLKLRGAGQFFGTQQSGIGDLAMENISNVRLIEICQKYAQQIISADPLLKKYPALQKEVEKLQKNTHLE